MIVSSLDDGEDRPERSLLDLILLAESRGHKDAKEVRRNTMLRTQRAIKKRVFFDRTQGRGRGACWERLVLWREQRG